MNTVSITLNTPLVLGGKTLDSLTMREPTMAEEEDAMAQAVDLGRGTVPLTTEMCMYALLCNISYDAVRGLKSADYQKLRDAYQRFTRPTGTLPEDAGGLCPSRTQGVAGGEAPRLKGAGTPDASSEPSGAAS